MEITLFNFLRFIGAIPESSVDELAEPITESPRIHSEENPVIAKDLAEIKTALQAQASAQTLESLRNEIAAISNSLKNQSLDISRLNTLREEINAVRVTQQLQADKCDLLLSEITALRASLAEQIFSTAQNQEMASADSDSFQKDALIKWQTSRAHGSPGLVNLDWDSLVVASAVAGSFPKNVMINWQESRPHGLSDFTHLELTLALQRWCANRGAAKATYGTLAVHAFSKFFKTAYSGETVDIGVPVRQLGERRLSKLVKYWYDH